MLEVLTEALPPTTDDRLKTEVLSVAILSTHTGRDGADNHKESWLDGEYFHSKTHSIAFVSRMWHQSVHASPTQKALLFYIGTIKNHNKHINLDTMSIICLEYIFLLAI